MIRIKRSYSIALVFTIVLIVAAVVYMAIQQDESQMWMLSYNGGGDAAGNAPNSTEAAEGEIVKIAGNTFTNYGYQFNGWTDGTVLYEPGDEYTMTSADVTLTAMWAEGGTSLQVFSADDNTGWWGVTAVTLGNDNPMEGTGYVESTADEVVIFCVVFNAPIDLTNFSDSELHMWIYVDNAANMRTESNDMGRIELNDVYSVFITNKIYGG